VKRKIKDRKITDHLMAVILGDQGVGKSTLLELMLNPVEEICVESDFKAIADDRNSMLLEELCDGFQ
jgi:ABC-type cobalamin/Fe3+-siderophores transport system ATPase subunit